MIPLFMEVMNKSPFQYYITDQESLLSIRQNYDRSLLFHPSNIVPPSDDDIYIERQLLLDLIEMEGTIHRNPYAYNREDKVLSMMCRELKTVGYRHIKAKMDRGDSPIRRSTSW
jgi:hypothetical protein